MKILYQYVLWRSCSVTVAAGFPVEEMVSLVQKFLLVIRSSLTFHHSIGVQNYISPRLM
jgi:hypothetical protein